MAGCSCRPTGASSPRPPTRLRPRYGPCCSASWGRPRPYDGVLGGFFPDPARPLRRAGRRALGRGAPRPGARVRSATWPGGRCCPGAREANGPGRAFALLHDRAGRLWVGGQTGLFRVSADFTSLQPLRRRARRLAPAQARHHRPGRRSRQPGPVDQHQRGACSGSRPTARTSCGLFG